jgi:hypothetical protein
MILKNRITTYLNILQDTRANSFLFLNTQLDTAFTIRINTPIEKLDSPVYITRYNNNSRVPIQYIICLHLIIDNQRFYHIPFLLIPLYQHDIIIRR